MDRGQIARIGAVPVLVERSAYRYGEDGAIVTWLPTLNRPIRADDQVLWVTAAELQPTCQHEGADALLGLLYCGRPPAVNSAYCLGHQVDHGEVGP